MTLTDDVDELYFYERGVSDGLINEFPQARNNPAYMKGYEVGQYVRQNNLELTHVDAVDLLTEYSTMASFNDKGHYHENISGT